MKTPPADSLARAFTLIELLVVISVIGILIGLLFPVVSSAMDYARRANARHDVTQISTAILSYQIEYGKLPPPVDNTDIKMTVSDELLANLRGTGGGNPRKVTFLDAKDLAPGSSRGRSGVMGTKYVDPWGSTYTVALDGNYDGMLSDVGTAPGPVANSLQKRVAVWNDVSTMPNTPPPAIQKRRAVADWE